MIASGGVGAAMLFGCSAGGSAAAAEARHSVATGGSRRYRWRAAAAEVSGDWRNEMRALSGADSSSARLRSVLRAHARNPRVTPCALPTRRRPVMPI